MSRGDTLSRELRWGTLLGKGSVDKLLDTLEKALGGKWARLLPYLKELPCKAELELVLIIYGDRLKNNLPPSIKACFAEAIAENPRLLAALEEVLAEEGESGEGYEYE